MLLGPNAALAATPTVSVGSTSPTATVSGASPSVVSIGETVRFQSTLQNSDPSTISQLFVKGFSDATIYSYGTPTVYTVALTRNGSTVNNACAAAADLSCSVRNVKPLDVIQVTVVYKVPLVNAGTTDPYSGDATCPLGYAQGYGTLPDPASFVDGPAVCVLVQWSTTGAPSSDGGTSHGDVWNWYDGAMINGDLQDFRSRWVVQSGQFIVANDQVINVDNPHSTQAIVKTADIPVSVEDVECPPAPALCEGLAGFGEVSQVDVNGGSIPGTTWYHFVLQADSSEIPNGTNQNNVVVNHIYDGGFETIVDRCTISNATGEPTNTEACIVVKKLAGNDLRIDVWSLHNGGLRLA
jgi:hypothetical protein